MAAALSRSHQATVCGTKPAITSLKLRAASVPAAGLGGKCQRSLVRPTSRGLQRVVPCKANASEGGNDAAEQRRLQRREARRREQMTYQFTAVAATLGVSATAAFATYYRIMRYMNNGESFPFLDLFGTLALCAGACLGMEMYARWVHKDMWHDNPVGWILHKSHHEARVGPFEANDIYAIMNAVPAIALCAYGFLRPDLVGALCFGAGLGITVYGICYMFVHDGLVHRRFPVGPIAELPAMKRIVLAHQLHHSEKYGGVPFGMFLGPQELEAVGAGPELDRLVAEAEANRAARKAEAAAGKR